MLDIAERHVKKLSNFRMNMALDLYYKYARCDYHLLKYEEKTNGWDNLNFVCLDDKKEVKGYIFFSINRPIYNASVTIASDKEYNILPELLEAIDKAFTKYNINKLSFIVLIGNPAEKIYDRFIENSGGRIVGIRYKHECNTINEICDVKIYEVLKEDYLKSKKTR